MNDLISRKWLVECVEEGWIKFDTEKDTNKFIHLIRDTAPSVQPERKMGKWITDKYGCVVCSECKWDAPKIIAGCLANRHLDYDKSDYCWHCGADMRGRQNETD